MSRLRRPAASGVPLHLGGTAHRRTARQLQPTLRECASWRAAAAAGWSAGLGAPVGTTAGPLACVVSILARCGAGVLCWHVCAASRLLRLQIFIRCCHDFSLVCLKATGFLGSGYVNHNHHHLTLSDPTCDPHPIQATKHFSAYRLTMCFVVFSAPRCIAYCTPRQVSMQAAAWLARRTKAELSHFLHHVH